MTLNGAPGQPFFQVISVRIVGATRVTRFATNANFFPIEIRAVPRLQIIGSPRGAAEKFDAKRVIGAAFF